MSCECGCRLLLGSIESMCRQWEKHPHEGDYCYEQGRADLARAIGGTIRTMDVERVYSGGPAGVKKEENA